MSKSKDKILELINKLEERGTHLRRILEPIIFEINKK